jgi:cyclic pyranopterin phosphate synthase
MRCRYCMPEAEYVWLPRGGILSFEEIDRLARIFIGLGVDKLRLTGGEPLLRQDLPELVGLLSGHAGLRDLALTTNGILLGEQAPALAAAGLRRVTVSLDTLRPERMKEFARSSRHADVLAGIAAAQAAGLGRVKLNSVVIRGYNDDELAELIEFGRTHGSEMRFIEYMDVGGATTWSLADVVPQAEILDRLARAFGGVRPAGGRGAAPAERFQLGTGETVGVIASTTQPFCEDCDRSRIAADGTWFTCLYAAEGIDLRTPLRAGATDDELAYLLTERWVRRTDRGAEQRRDQPDRGVLHQIGSLRADPRREMHTRGG